MLILLTDCVSLGLGTIDLAAKSASLALIVESSFLSVAAMAAKKYRYLPNNGYCCATTIGVRQPSRKLPY